MSNYLVVPSVEYTKHLEKLHISDYPRVFKYGVVEFVILSLGTATLESVLSTLSENGLEIQNTFTGGEIKATLLQHKDILELLSTLEENQDVVTN